MGVDRLPGDPFQVRACVVMPLVGRDPVDQRTIEQDGPSIVSALDTDATTAVVKLHRL